MAKRVLLVLTGLVLAVPLGAQAVQRDSLLNHMVGSWVIRGRMAGKDVVHDVTFQWVLGGEYLEMHEVSRERTPAKAPAYEAIVYLVHDPHTKEYGALWLDNTDYNAFLAPGQGHGVAAGDSIPLIFTYSATDRVHTTFAYYRATDTWEWHMDNEDARGRRPFARVKMTRH